MKMLGDEVFAMDRRIWTRIVAIPEILPIGVLHFPGTGIQDNLADKAKKLGIPVWKFGAG
jgi:hypothetical protein